MGSLGEKMRQRNDGATLWLRSKITVRFELPVYDEAGNVIETRVSINCVRDLAMPN